MIQQKKQTNKTQNKKTHTKYKKLRDILKYLLGSGRESKYTQHVCHQGEVTPTWRFVTEISLVGMRHEWKCVSEITRKKPQQYKG